MEPITITVLAGAVGTFLTAVLTRAEWSGDKKRIAALIVYLVLAAVTWYSVQYPANWEYLAMQLGIIAGAGQITYTALKPTGLLDLLESSTTGKHIAEDELPQKEE